MTPQGDTDDTPKGDKNDTPGVTLMTPPINNNHQPTTNKTTNDPPTNHQTVVVEILEKFGIPKTKAEQLAALPHASIDYVNAIIADVRSDRAVRNPVGAAIHRIEINWHVKDDAEYDADSYAERLIAQGYDIRT